MCRRRRMHRKVRGVTHERATCGPDLGLCRAYLRVSVQRTQTGWEHSVSDPRVRLLRAPQDVGFGPPKRIATFVQYAREERRPGVLARSNISWRGRWPGCRPATSGVPAKPASWGGWAFEIRRHFFNSSWAGPSPDRDLAGHLGHFSNRRGRDQRSGAASFATPGKCLPSKVASCWPCSSAAAAMRASPNLTPCDLAYRRN